MTRPKPPTPAPPAQWYVRRRRARAAQADAAVTARTSSFNPAFDQHRGGVTATSAPGLGRRVARWLWCPRGGWVGGAQPGRSTLSAPLTQVPLAAPPSPANSPAVTTQRSPTKKQLLQVGGWAGGWAGGRAGGRVAQGQPRRAVARGEGGRLTRLAPPRPPLAPRRMPRCASEALAAPIRDMRPAPALTPPPSAPCLALAQEAAEMLEAGRSPLRDSMIARQQQQ